MPLQFTDSLDKILLAGKTYSLERTQDFTS